MPRTRRAYLPGTAFHVTTKSLNSERWFTAPIRDRIVDILADALPHSDAQLNAFVVMTNHMHLVVRQGDMPLGVLMQILKRRIALMVQRRLKRTGPIFVRRYFAIPCSDPDHLRAAIAYTHRNPVTAKLCQDACEYRWSSHRHYCGEPPLHTKFRMPELVAALELFGRREDLNAAELSAAYREFYDHRHDVKAAWEQGEARPLGIPAFTQGDVHWQQHFAHRKQARERAARADLRDIARAVLSEQGAGLDLELVRLSRGGPAFIAARYEIVERAVRAGYMNSQIAQFLDLSPARVSTIVSTLALSLARARAVP